jgi:enoyl-CoA hydratase
VENSDDPKVHVSRDQRKEGVVATVTIDNARRLNAMSRAVMGDFIDAFAGLANDAGLRAVVLTGAGAKSFIVGADINEMADLQNSMQAKGFITRLHRCCDAIRSLPVPVIARIGGYCFGAGLEVAAACDVRIASEDALFGMPEVKLGIPSVIEAALLPALVGWGRAREILFLGEPFTAKEALTWRLVEHAVPASALDATVEAWIGKLLTSAPGAVRLQKRLIRQWEDLTLSAAIGAGVGAFAAAYETDEPATAMHAFLSAQKSRKREG